MQPIFKDAYYHRFSNIWFFVPILLLSVTVITMVSKGLLPNIMYYSCLKIYLKSPPAPNILLYIHMTVLKSLLKQSFSPSKILFIVEFSILHDNFKFLSPGNNIIEENIMPGEKLDQVCETKKAKLSKWGASTEATVPITLWPNELPYWGDTEIPVTRGLIAYNIWETWKEAAE